MTNDFGKELELDKLVDSFFSKKEKLDNLKKETDCENKRIKELMEDLNLDEFTNTNGNLKAKIIVQNRESFIESALIKKLVELNCSEAIDLVQVVNYDKLEDLIYNGKLNACDIIEFKETKQVKTLKITRKKG